MVWSVDAETKESAIARLQRVHEYLSQSGMKKTVRADALNADKMSALPTPRDAAAVILLRPSTDPNNPEVYWVKRSPKLAFLGGYRAFSGGQRESLDSEVRVRNGGDEERSAMISC